MYLAEHLHQDLKEAGHCSVICIGNDVKFVTCTVEIIGMDYKK